jgi:hypothetical protein
MFDWLVNLITMIINFIMSFFVKKQVQFSEDTKKESVDDQVIPSEEENKDMNVVVNE